MRILSSIVHPAPRFLLVSIYYDHHRCAIGTQFVRYNNSRSAIAFHGISFEFQSGFAISVLTHITFPNFTFVIHGPPEVMHLSIDLCENLARAPLPVQIRSHPTDPVSSYLSSKHRTKSIPPKQNCFKADLNTTFVQKIFHVTE